MPKIRMPDGQVVSFPDTMGRDQISDLIKEKADSQRLNREMKGAGFDNPKPEQEFLTKNYPQMLLSALESPQGMVMSMAAPTGLGRLLTRTAKAAGNSRLAAATMAGARELPLIGKPLKAAARVWEASGKVIPHAIPLPGEGRLMALTPQEIAAQEALLKGATPAAKLRGMLSAAGRAEEAWGK